MDHKVRKAMWCLAIIFTALTISLPFDVIVNDYPHDSEDTAFSRVLNDIRDGNAVYGIAPEVSHTSIVHVL